MSEPVIPKRQAYLDASKLAKKIGYKCLLDDGWFDTTRCAAYIEQVLIERDTTIERLTEALTDALGWMKHHDPYPPAGGVYHRGDAALTQPAAKEEK